MPLPLIGLWRSKRKRRHDPFTRATRDDLDIMMPPPYDMSAERRQAHRAQIEDLVRRLQPKGLDAGSLDVLGNFVNALAAQSVAELDAERDERQAVGEVLIGLAREELARREPGYLADLARVAQTHEALEVTFKALTGKNTAELRGIMPRRLTEGPIRSTLGPIDLTDTWIRTDGSGNTDAEAGPDAEPGPGRPGIGPEDPDAGQGAARRPGNRPSGAPAADGDRTDGFRFTNPTSGGSSYAGNGGGSSYTDNGRPVGAPSSTADHRRAGPAAQGADHGRAGPSHGPEHGQPAGTSSHGGEHGNDRTHQPGSPGGPV